MMQVWSLWAIARKRTHTHHSPTYTILESSELTHVNEMIDLCFDGTSVICWGSWHGYDPRMPCSKEDDTDRRRGRMIFTRVADHCQRSGEERELSFSSVHYGPIRFSHSLLLLVRVSRVFPMLVGVQFGRRCCSTRLGCCKCFNA